TSRAGALTATTASSRYRASARLLGAEEYGVARATLPQPRADVLHLHVEPPEAQALLELPIVSRRPDTDHAAACERSLDRRETGIAVQPVVGAGRQRVWPVVDV